MKKNYVSFIIISLIFLTTVCNKALAADQKLFIHDLHLGSNSNEVLLLQKYLNTHDFPIAISGIGSLGKESDYFGNKTKMALKKFQKAHAEQILKPLGLAKGSGNFYFSTRKFVNDSLIYTPIIQTSTPTTTINNTTSSIPITSSTVSTSKSTLTPYYSYGGSPATIPSFTIGGTVSNLNNILILQNNNNETLNVSSNNFTFLTKLYNGQNYNVTILSQPDGENCSLSNAIGVVTGNVTNISIDCLTIPTTSIPTITNFNNITKTYGDAPFSLSASSTSGGEISYTSNNTDVASISDNTVTIHDAGSILITLHQAASTGFTSTTANITLTINSLNTIISDFIDLNIVYDGTFQTLSSISPNNGTKNYSSGNSSVATSVGNSLFILGSGTSTLSVSQDAYQGYSAATATALLTVSSTCASSLCHPDGSFMTSTATCAMSNDGEGGYTCSGSCTYPGLTGQFCDIGMDQCATNPCGLINGVCTRTSTIPGINPPLNSYFCTCNSGWAGDNCDIIATSPTIDFSAINKTIGDDPFEFFITSNSTGTFSYSSSNTGVATVSGNICTIHNTGTSTITVDQLAHGVFLSGHTSTLLTIYPDLCTAEEPCLNGGTCTNAPGTGLGFTCSCVGGFSGDFCEMDNSNCNSDGYCLNGGTCVATPAHGECSCAPCFMGTQCDEYNPECA